MIDASSVRALPGRAQVSSPPPRWRGRLKHISALGCVCVMLLPSMAEDAAMAAGVQRILRPARASLMMAVIGRQIEEKPRSQPDTATGDCRAACQTAGHTFRRCTTLPAAGGEQKTGGPRQGGGLAGAAMCRSRHPRQPLHEGSMQPGAALLESPRQRGEEDAMEHREKAGPGIWSIRISMPCQTAPLQGGNNKMATLR
jgi:hypothetical protein